MVRDAVSPDDFRAAWDAIETLWQATHDRARLLPEAIQHEQVNGEWSFVETQRHLLFASDAWLGNAVLEEEAPYHPLGFPAGGTPPDAAAKLGLTLGSIGCAVASRQTRTPTRSTSCAAASRSY